MSVSSFAAPCNLNTPRSQLLGVNVYIETQVTDANTFITNSHAVTSSTCTGLPVSGYGYLMCIRFGGYGVQIWSNLSATLLYYRSANISVAGSFSGSSWNQIQLVS